VYRIVRYAQIFQFCAALAIEPTVSSRSEARVTHRELLFELARGAVPGLLRSVSVIRSPNPACERTETEGRCSLVSFSLSSGMAVAAARGGRQ
jgi:hypothetical protein